MGYGLHVTSMNKLNTADVLGEEFVEIVGLTLGRNCLPLYSSMWVALHAPKQRLFQASIPTRMGDGIPSSCMPDFIESSFIDSVPDSIEVSESNYMRLAFWFQTRKCRRFPGRCTRSMHQRDLRVSRYALHTCVLTVAGRAVLQIALRTCYLLSVSRVHL